MSSTSTTIINGGGATTAISSNLWIPLRDSKEVVQIPTSELLSIDSSSMIGILKDESAPLDIWLNTALEYLKLGKDADFETILQRATSDGDSSSASGGSANDSAHYQQQQQQPEGRIKLLNALAGYYIEKARSNRSDNEQKEEFYSRANQLIKTAEMIDHLHTTTFASKGVMYLNQNEHQRAMGPFGVALTSDPHNVPAMLGKACILYNQKNYKEALELYQEVLKTVGSSCPAAVRLGIGLCHYNLGNLKMARYAFERVLQLEDNANALVALAILDLNSPVDQTTDSSSSSSHIERAMKRFTKAFSLDPSNPMVLNHLANHFFYNNQMEKAQTLASNAYKNSQVDEVRAESCYHMARSYHATGNYEAAFSHYYRIVMHLWPDFVLGRFGLGQMYLQRNDIDKAMGEFQRVLKMEPDNFETNKILGALSAEKGKFDQALSYYQKAHSINPNDEQVLVEISKFEHHSPQVALDALLKAKHIMEMKNQSLSHELYINLACLYHRLGDIKEAHKYAIKSLDTAGITLNEAIEMDVSSHNLSFLFNVARILQDARRTQHAKKLFLNILKHHIGYYDCYLALAMIHHEDGDDTQALAYLKTATKLFPKNPVTFCAMGYIYMNQTTPNYNLAQKQFEHVNQNIDAKDGTALVGLGTIYFHSATSSKTMEMDKSEKYLQYASDYFERALRYDPHNMYAALSLGAVLAQRGYLSDAREIFTNVQESSALSLKAKSCISTTWLNLAHVFMCQKQFTNAALLYQKVLKKLYDNTHVPTLHCLAASYYDDRKLKECKSILQQALVIAPNDINLWYDLAAAHHENCVAIMKSDKPTVSQAQEALNEIERANALFVYVSQFDNSKISHKAKGYVEHCAKTQKKAEEVLEVAKEKERQLQETEKHRTEALDRLKREQQLKKEQEDLKKKEEEDLKKKRAEELLEKTRELREKYSTKSQRSMDVDEDEEGGGKKRKRKSKKKRDEEEEEEEAPRSDSDDGGEKKKKKKGGRLKKGKDAKKPKKKKRKQSSDDEEEPETGGDDTAMKDEADTETKVEDETKKEEASSKVNPEGEEEFQFE